MCKKIFLIQKKTLYCTLFFVCRDQESIERINKIKKTRTEDSDEEDINAEEEDYEDDDVSVRNRIESKFEFSYFLEKVNEEDEKALEAFMSGQPRRLLGDIIAEKQAENQASGYLFFIRIYSL